jgi:phytoene synthase
MQAELHSWERSLLSLAQEAHLSHTSSETPHIAHHLLDEAYAWCDQVTAQNSRSFHMASSLLPLEKKRAVRALYAVCRVTDDIVDRPQGGNTLATLDDWRTILQTNPAPANELVAVAWADARSRFDVPVRYVEQLLDGVARDTVQTRYETFDDLAAYSYGVASTVGLMSMHIIGFGGEEAVPYAIKLGVALQVTNILRDVAEDWRNGRLYLPQEELRSFGVSEEEIGAGAVTPAWRNLMRFQIERNRRLYDEAWPGISMLSRDGRLAIAAAADLYRGILVDIERHDYDTFSRRAYVNNVRKVGMLPSIWSRSRKVHVA